MDKVILSEGLKGISLTLRPGRLFERSQKPPFQGGYTGSNPVPTTAEWRSLVISFGS